MRGQGGKKAKAPAAKNRGGSTKEARRFLPRFLETSGQILLWCAWVVAVIFGAELLAGLVLWPLADRLGAAEMVAWLGIIYYTVSVIVIVLVPVWWQKRRSNEATSSAKSTTNPPSAGAVRSEIGLRGTPTWTDIGLAPVGYVASLVVSSALTSLFQYFAWFDADQAQDIGFSFLPPGWVRVLVFVTLAIVAPVAEEIIFRGWLYGRVRGRLTGRLAEGWVVLISSVVVSLAFALVHGQWNVGVTVFALSMVLCGLREITGTIYAGTLTHIIQNSIALFLLFVVGI